MKGEYVGSKKQLLAALLKEEDGYLSIKDAVDAGISRAYARKFAHEEGLERIAQGLYISSHAWEDPFYILQYRYPQSIFSHETALYLLGLAEREPSPLSLTMKSSASSSRLQKDALKVYKVKDDLLNLGVTQLATPYGKTVFSYCLERTVVDIMRSRSQIEAQDFQSTLKAYARSNSKDLSKLMEYAKAFSVEKLTRQYMEVLL